MRAALITEPGGPEVLQMQEIEDPTFGPDDVLVEVKASALNRADLA
ncbi:MAG: NAD(P)H-quinone oxidoreductase, partial [Chloroflexi bacterium]|nr:NAD(P)H-quinone oxidoreductase [Chloroflexota bacterium]